MAYVEFLKANGIELSEAELAAATAGERGGLDGGGADGAAGMDGASNLLSEQLLGAQLRKLSSRDGGRLVTVTKARGEPLGIVLVDAGWGALLPTPLLANMAPNAPAARSGQLNIGDQFLAVNGQSLVGLPLASCQQIVKVRVHTRFKPILYSLVLTLPLFNIGAHKKTLELEFLFGWITCGRGVGRERAWRLGQIESLSNYSLIFECLSS